MSIISRIMRELDFEETGPIPIRLQVRAALIEVHNDAIKAAGSIALRNSNNGYLHGCDCSKDILALKIGAPE